MIKHLFAAEYNMLCFDELTCFTIFAAEYNALNRVTGWKSENRIYEYTHSENMEVPYGGYVALYGGG